MSCMASSCSRGLRHLVEYRTWQLEWLHSVLHAEYARNVESLFRHRQRLSGCHVQLHCSVVTLRGHQHSQLSWSVCLWQLRIQPFLGRRSHVWRQLRIDPRSIYPNQVLPWLSLSYWSIPAIQQFNTCLKVSDNRPLWLHVELLTIFRQVLFFNFFVDIKLFDCLLLICFSLSQIKVIIERLKVFWGKRWLWALWKANYCRGLHWYG